MKKFLVFIGIIHIFFTANYFYYEPFVIEELFILMLSFVVNVSITLLVYRGLIILYKKIKGDDMYV